GRSRGTGSGAGDAAPPAGEIKSGPQGPAVVSALIADIEGVTGRDITAQLAEALADCPGLEARLARKKLKPHIDSDGLVEKLAASGIMGRSWLASENADVLVWGEAIGTEGAATIRFLPAALDAEGKTGTFGLGDSLELPIGFGREFGDVAAASTIAAAVAVKSESEEALGSVLAAAVGRVSGYVESPPPGLTISQLVSLLTCIGNCFAALWRVDGGDAHLERALKIYELALGSFSRNDMPIPYALIQNHMAATFDARAGVDSDPAPLEAAAKAYHAVAAALGRAEHPQDWAFAQNRLGMTLYRLALRRDSDPSHLQASVKALDQARLVFTREDAPDRWAEVTNQIGVAMLALGTQVAGTEALERSVNSFRDALEVRRQDAAPLLWAQTANNLGAASFALFRRSKNPALLEEAIDRFEGARAIYTRFRQHRTVAVIEKNLARARGLLRQR
ncbi:MAG: hypothetical protein MI741_17445, partial [Rhodospirillales bacterium]|nr:hypothetical protein [Rhodospirillales bacterium]